MHLKPEVAGRALQLQLNRHVPMLFIILISHPHSMLK